MQEHTKATYREILERRAQEVGLDFADGVAQAVTPLAVYESVMVAAYRAIMSGDVVVDAMTGMRAAERLLKVSQSRNPQAELQQMRCELDEIIAAVHSVVPTEMWSIIVDRLDEHRRRKPTFTGG